MNFEKLKYDWGFCKKLKKIGRKRKKMIKSG